MTTGSPTGEVVERLRVPLTIEYVVPVPVMDVLQRAADEREEAATLLQSLEARIEALSEALEHIYCDCRGRLVGAGDGETRIVGTPSPAALEKARAALTPSNRDRT